MACWYRRNTATGTQLWPRGRSRLPCVSSSGQGPRRPVRPTGLSTRPVRRRAGRPRFERQLEATGRAGEVLDVVDVRQPVARKLVDLREQLIDGANLILGEPSRVAELAELVVDLGQVGEQNGGRIHGDPSSGKPAPGCPR